VIERKERDLLSTFLLIQRDECPLPTYPWGIRTS